MLPILWMILAVICVLYGFLILSLASGTGFFAVWFILAAVFVVFAAAAKFHLWQKLPGIGKGVFLVILIAGAALFVFVEALVCTGFGKQGEPGLDYLIVLGAQVRENGPSVVLRYRLDAAYDYLKENPDTRCIVSGGQGANEPCPEAEGMKTYLLGRGIPEDRILAEPASHSTKENIDNSMALLDPEKDRVGIVTNNFHLFRGCGIAGKAGIRHVSGIAAGSRILYLPNNMLREFFGVLKDFLAGNL